MDKGDRMKRKKRRQFKRLIAGCLEGVSKRVFAEYAHQIAEMAGRKPGIYALYRKRRLYYVGLATDLKSRVKHHLSDKHARNWDTFSLYLVRSGVHLKDLEAMTIRIAHPEGNNIRGGRLFSLKPELKAQIDDWNARNTNRILGLSRHKPRHRPPEHRRTGKFDTIVCPAHGAGFKRAFLNKRCWYAIRLGKGVIPRLKYIAIYVTSPVKEISHYGRIRSIKPWKKSGKYIVYLKGAPVPVGPIPYGGWVALQSCRLTTLRKLKKAKTVAGAF
jgi:hypothetical protein